MIFVPIFLSKCKMVPSMPLSLLSACRKDYAVA